jgi:7-keto-8-aminopelargonate synthetase-like enzyme
MRTSTAYISKLKNEALGRTYKVQDTNHRLFTSTLYRGAAGCGPVDYTQIDYIELCRCDYIGLSPRPPKPPAAINTIDGGSPMMSGSIVLDGGSPMTSGSIVIDGGKP